MSEGHQHHGAMPAADAPPELTVESSRAMVRDLLDGTEPVAWAAVIVPERCLDCGEWSLALVLHSNPLLVNRQGFEFLANVNIRSLSMALDTGMVRPIDPDA